MKNKIIFIKFISSLLLTTYCLLLTTSAFATPINEYTLISLVNQERNQKGFNSLTVNPLLYLAAQNKAQDMLENNYFEHYTPIGKSPWDFIHQAGYFYSMAGENLAMDFQTAEGVHRTWMASPGHRDNILRPEYQEIGIAVVKGDFDNHTTNMVVQYFARPYYSEISTFSSVLEKIRYFILGFK